VDDDGDDYYDYDDDILVKGVHIFTPRAIW
jgi:hypothetical protein